MTDIDSELVLVRLRLLVNYRNTLEEFRSVSLDEYLSDFRQQLIVERLLQLMAEAATDINKNLLVQLHNISPATSINPFLEAGRQGIITPELAAELAQAAGMRNILVHQYKEIDSRIVFTAIQKALAQYPLYIQQITVYLDLLEEKDA
ncbi:DUF86 domain-containing protein [Funiculus sociatus GB2-A5]|jgi:uncharacterized protein YutE (UPF0331/DUF86 family)|uniref:DUF86 domain-containing protein n=1 Tax=Funiculus sociatus GB2-A5 TaxID=2933946 RepID=A0ABV0JTW0_9CYAN|nr:MULTISPECIES: DUF86 domain-containing protein [unclassified Trichocoleus]MBD1906745.1 DUF86 domain-containing protein [Trichocoleus sp. FACHB-832]MBD2061478.1 DUF86 domain-containing protein [Trichocoleus sp. FACHB-6]